jgi:hypothetical protein
MLIYIYKTKNGVEIMKTIKEIKEDFSKLDEVKNQFHYTNKKPSQVIQDAYQEVYDFLYTLLSAKQNYIKNELKEQEETEGQGQIQVSRMNASLKEDLNVLELEKNFLSRNLVVAGGCLSEVFIDGEYKFKDIDIFLNKEFSNYLSFGSYKEIGEEYKNELLYHLKKSGFNISKNNIEKKNHTVPFEQNERYLQNKNIYKVLEKMIGGIKVELIIMHEMDFDFDLSFRECFYNGDTIFYSDAAKKDFENKTISIKSFTTPFSTLLRLEEFSKRYPLEINTGMRNLLLKYNKLKTNSNKEILINKFKFVKKYKEEEIVERIVNEILNIEITKREKDIIEWLSKGLENFIYLYEARINKVLEDEKNGISYDLKRTIEIKSFSFNNDYSFSVNKDEIAKIERIFELNKRKQNLFKIVNDSNEYSINSNVLKDMKRNGLAVNSSLYNLRNFQVAQTQLILQRLMNDVQNLTKEEVIKQLTFEKELEDGEKEALYYAAISNECIFEVDLTHLIFEGLHGSTSLKYNAEQEESIPLVVDYSEDDISISFDRKFAFSFNNRLDEAKKILANELKIGKIKYKEKFFVDSGINTKSVTKERTQKTTLDIYAMLQEKKILEDIADAKQNDLADEFNDDLPF